MSFVWDEKKRASNLERHGVDFADAVGALLDPFSVTREDPDAEGEARFVTLGCGVTGLRGNWVGVVGRLDRA